MKNNAGSFFAQYHRNNPLDTWAETRQALIEQYSEEGETQVASQKLRRLQQKSSETVQNFGERILALASEAYGANLQQPLVQAMLVDILIDGIKDDRTARRLIGANPNNLDLAMNIAVQEQTASRNFRMRCKNDEPMDVDSVSSPAESVEYRLGKLESNLSEVLEQVGQLLDVVKGLTQQRQIVAQPVIMVGR